MSDRRDFDDHGDEREAAAYLIVFAVFLVGLAVGALVF